MRTFTLALAGMILLSVDSAQAQSSDAAPS